MTDLTKEGWEIIGIDDLERDGAIQLGRGKIISKKDMAACPGRYPVYSSAKENEGKFGEYGQFMFDEELVTWSVDGGGRLFHRPRHKFSITNVGGFVRILEKGRINCRYLYFALSYLHSQVTFDWIRKAHPSVIRKVYNEIPLPPLEEQKRIVSILDEAFEGLDRARANTEANLQDARELLNGFREEFFESQIRSGWHRVSLSELINIKHGFAFKSAHFSERGTNAVLTPGNFYETGGYRDRGEKQRYYSAEFPPEFLLTAGDLLVAMTEQAPGLLGSCIIVPNAGSFLHNQRLGLITPHEGVAWCPEYFAQAFNTKAVRQGLSDTCTGATVRHTSPSRILALSIPYFDDESELLRVAEILQQRDEDCRRMEIGYQEKLRDLEDLGQSLLQRAFVGELT